MSYIKKNKKQTGIIVGIILIVILLIICIFALLPNTTKSSWGNRLDGIEEHEVADTVIDTIKTSIMENGEAKSVDYRLSGRTMNFIITVNSDVSKDNAIKLTSYILENIETDDQSYYDIQVMFTTEEENSDYPFIGYKHKTSNEFSYEGDAGE